MTVLLVYAHTDTDNTHIHIVTSRISPDGKKISALVKRSEIFSGQAPEAFRFGVYYEANRRLLPDTILTINGSTEPAVMAGLDMIMIAGDEDNFKITTKEDLERFRELIKRRNNNTGER